MTFQHDPYTKDRPQNPVEPLLRMDRMPSIWCSGCGIGTTVNCFARAVEKTGISLDDMAIVSGIGCTGRVAGYAKVDSYHTTHGRGIAFATGLKMANPKLNVVVYSGDGDLSAIGGNHLIHAARRNLDITVICVNNFIYGMTGGQVAPTTPAGTVASTMPFGNYDPTFNLPKLVASAGAVYVARWTAFHVRQVSKAMKEAMLKPGFSFVEVIAPCPTLYLRRNRLGDGLAEMKYYKEQSIKMNGADPSDPALELKMREPIAVGKFVDLDKPHYIDGMNDYYAGRLGDAYTKYEG
jgi:2-oxoglutarate/2-oxoacid ferredoxin oxidoreductase subunit beta